MGLAWLLGCVCQAYPNFTSAHQELLAQHAFIQVLLPERLQQDIHLDGPVSLTAAIKEAVRAGDVLSAEIQHINPTSLTMASGNWQSNSASPC